VPQKLRSAKKNTMIMVPEIIEVSWEAKTLKQNGIIFLLSKQVCSANQSCLNTGRILCQKCPWFCVTKNTFYMLHFHSSAPTLTYISANFKGTKNDNLLCSESNSEETACFYCFYDTMIKDIQCK
jgi:hypothetical protein